MFRMPALADLLLSVPAVLWAITFHEFCHGYMAYVLGDPTAKRMGRLSLNPLHHLDPVGALMLLFFRFGWAKPVPVDPRYFKNPRRDMVLVSAAGVTGNFLTAFVFGMLARFFPQTFLAIPALRQFIFLMIVINIGLAVFNLIPIPPLDGSKLLYPLLPPFLLEKYFWLERYGFFVLMILLALGVVQAIMGPVVMFFLRLILF
ncbi:MAG: site-2 protease family protein [Synergistaceae bacterium]|jgi:Zn-dependent protease|uniref:site-2 protease family protein n=1 Tax=Aminivibrio sp. TaxID=1872489 RepID=UPI001D5AE287|nr:site-2 protease family protein [Synergistaceae bacterium]NCC57216.1 site-2 protease family protein [Synergistales bacterium]MDD3390371.1 site-2 protease family protein [Synergistaceae bacterium]MDD3688427.1 site-2 protease family protein [Synergistaceae bacterium]MDD4020484.1 site-2 protease family protein [Synergistaceae bacterium]